MTFEELYQLPIGTRVRCLDEDVTMTGRVTAKQYNDPMDRLVAIAFDDSEGMFIHITEWDDALHQFLCGISAID